VYLHIVFVLDASYEILKLFPDSMLVSIHPIQKCLNALCWNS